MSYSQACVALVKEFEGYHDALPDGRCQAYQRVYNGKLDVPTIGWGTTKGVRMGMVWTRDEAEAALCRELDEVANDVRKLVTVDLNQNQVDALVSFQYNVGKLGSSTLLKKLNRGDYPGAQAEFMRWVYAGGAPQRGLARRRAAEAELFARRTMVEEEVKAPLSMPQTVDPPKEPMGNVAKATIIGGATTVANQALISGPPAVVTDTVSSLSSWQTVTQTAIGIATAAWSSPQLMVVAGGLAIAGIWILPRLARR